MYNEIVRSSVPNIPVRIGWFPNARPFPPHMVSKMHYHDEIELIRIDVGNFRCSTANQNISTTSGDIIYIAPRTPHETETLTHGTKTTLVQFDINDFASFKSNLNKSLYRYINTGETPIYIFKAGTEENLMITNCIDIIVKESTWQKHGYEHFVNSGVQSIIGSLYRYNLLHDTDSFFDNKYIDKVMPALSYIDIHYAEPLNLEAVSETVNINPSYFCRVFKKSTNSTFTEYLNFVRVMKSEKRLTNHADSISDIAMSVGFSSVSYFNRVFKRVKGISPSDYRKIRYNLK